jgi:F-type H+-transporting ATPase subunit delta
MNSQQILNKRYALAYLHLHETELDLSVCDRMQSAADFLKNTSAAQLVLKLTTLQSSVYTDTIKALIEQFRIPLTLMSLIALLIEHNRLSLLPDVLASIVSLYKEKQGILTYTIVSSHTLDASAKEAILAFLHKQSDKKIIYKEKIDQSLIAGIRLQSETLLWEYSVKKQLSQLQHHFNV